MRAEEGIEVGAVDVDFAAYLREGDEALVAVVFLLWLDEYSYDEIADTLGLKRNTVAVKIHRIKEKLAQAEKLSKQI